MSKVKPVALTQEENNARLFFIGKCVDENLTIPNYTKFGVTQPMTVQELTSSSDKTLESIYVSIQKQQNEASLGLKASKPLEISGISAQVWLDFIKLTVQNREYVAYQKQKAKEVNAVKAQLESMKSPSQKKKELQKLLAELEA